MLLPHYNLFISGVIQTDNTNSYSCGIFKCLIYTWMTLSESKQYFNYCCFNSSQNFTCSVLESTTNFIFGLKTFQTSSVFFYLLYLIITIVIIITIWNIVKVKWNWFEELKPKITNIHTQGFKIWIWARHWFVFLCLIPHL